MFMPSRRIAKIVMPATLALCIGLSGIWLGHRGKTCRDYAPHIFALTTLILSVLVLHYVLVCCIYVGPFECVSRALSDPWLGAVLHPPVSSLACLTPPDSPTSSLAYLTPPNPRRSGPHRARALHTPLYRRVFEPRQSYLPHSPRPTLPSLACLVSEKASVHPLPLALFGSCQRHRTRRRGCELGSTCGSPPRQPGAVRDLS